MYSLSEIFDFLIDTFQFFSNLASYSSHRIKEFISDMF